MPLVLLAGCGQSIKLDVRCLAYPQRGFLAIDCADQETWEKYQLRSDK